MPSKDYVQRTLEEAAILFKKGELVDAEQKCREALGHDPWNLPVKNLLAGIMRQSKRLPEAIDVMEEVVKRAPTIPEFRLNCGDLYLESSQYSEAEVCYQEAITLRPNYVRAWFQSGVLKEKLGRIKDAIICFERVIQFDSQNLEAFLRLAFFAQSESRIFDQLRFSDTVLKMSPKNIQALHIRASALFNQGKIQEAACDLRLILSLVPADIAARSTLMMCLNYDPNLSPDDVRREHEVSSGYLSEQVETCDELSRNDWTQEKVLRIGYVSSDFMQHPVSQFFKPVISHYDRTRFIVHLYFNGKKNDSVTAWYQQHCDVWRDISSLSTKEVTKLIQNDNIDILVDLAGYTGNHRLQVFAMRPAPIQITWLGYPSTTGMKSIDYLLSDKVVDPMGSEPNITESLWRLPDAFCTFDEPISAPAIAPLPALQKGVVTFGSMHSLAKLNDYVLNLWCDVLKEIPASELLIYRSALLPYTHSAFRDRFLQRGIAGNRVHLEYEKPASGTHLDVYNRIDVHLDAFPWSGHTTTCEALWMGVPTLTLLGDRHASRMSASILTQAGLQDFIADSRQKFIESAGKLTSNLNALNIMRSLLRSRLRDSNLTNGPKFTKDLEFALQAMWRTKCRLATEIRQ